MSIPTRNSAHSKLRPITEEEYKSLEKASIEYGLALYDERKAEERTAELVKRLRLAEKGEEDAMKLEEFGKQKIEQAKALNKCITVEVFCAALGLESPEENDKRAVNAFATKHSTEKAVGDIGGKIALISMEPFATYLENNPREAKKIFKLNFTPIRVLADTLPQNLYKFLNNHPQITKIGFDPCVQEKLDAAMNKLCPKERTFTIIYVPRAKSTQENETSATAPKKEASKPDIEKAKAISAGKLTKSSSSEEEISSDEDPNYNPYTDSLFGPVVF